MVERPARKYLSPKSLSVIGIPKKFHSKTLDDLRLNSGNIKYVKEFFVEYLENFMTNIDKCHGIILHGSNGSGKTHIACVLAKEAYRRRLSTRRTTFVEYIDHYTRSWGTRSLDEREMEDDDFNTNYKTVEFLVLEEIGKEIDSKIAAPVLEDCLRYREDNSLVTIICTNLDLDQIQERYGNSVLSLIRGNMTVVEFNELDSRRDAFADNLYEED